MPKIFYKIYAYPPFILQWFIRLFVLFVFKTFTRLEVRGLDNLALHKGPLIFASNHASEWDGPLIRSVLPMFSRFGPMLYVSREKSFYNERFGWRAPFYGGFLFKLVGAFPVVVGQRDYETSLRNHISILKDGGSLNIFPEGGTGKNGVLKEGRGGTVYLSVKTQTSIVPVGISGLYNLSLRIFLERKRKVVLSFGSPYIPNTTSSNEDVPIEEYKPLTQELMIKINYLMGAIFSL